MASTLDEPDEFPTTAQHSAFDSATTSNALCDLCLQALTIDDKLAGGALTNAYNDGETALDLSGFTRIEWRTSDRSGRGLRNSRRKEKREPGEYGWIWEGERTLEDGTSDIWHCRRAAVGNNHERLVTPSTLPELAKSCEFCSTLREIFYQEYGESPWWKFPDSMLRFQMQYEWWELRTTKEREGKVVKIELEQRLECLAVIVRHPGLNPGYVDAYEFEIGSKPGICRDWLGIVYDLLDINGPASGTNIQFMKNCIDECVEDHTGCMDRLLKNDFVPTRLLDIGNDTTSYIKLIERSQIPLEGSPDSQLKYATLSYCWGNSLPLKTTEQTLEQHKTGIPIHDLPAVFQDAVHVARKLEIRFIWIDALCIIQDQDSKRDWEAESVTMSDVFAHSYVTICAASSTSCSESFLRRPPPKLLTLPFRSSLRPNVSGEYSIFLRGRRQWQDVADLEHSRWISRGWVWQEQVMATRQLVFVEEALQFRCNTTVCLEYGRSAKEYSLSLTKRTDYQKFWFDVITQYSQRHLTHAEDRLAAVAGAAKLIQASLKDAGEPKEYLAGLWLDDDSLSSHVCLDDNFSRHLCWVYDEPTLSYTMLLEQLNNDKEYCAPSWSWASRNTTVYCILLNMDSQFQVVSYDLQPAHSDAMVAVRFGSSITLKGKCRQTPVKPTTGVLRREPTWGKRRLNCWEASSPHGNIEFWLDWVPDLDNREQDDRQNQLQLFLISYDNGFIISGLLLLPFEGSGGILHRRVGAFRMWNRDCDQLFTDASERTITIL